MCYYRCSGRTGVFGNLSNATLVELKIIIISVICSVMGYCTAYSTHPKKAGLKANELIMFIRETEVTNKKGAKIKLSIYIV